MIKFADDTTLIGLIQDGNEEGYRLEIKRMETWCEINNLKLNVSKTKELVVDFRKVKQSLAPIKISGNEVEQVSSFKLLGVTLQNDLKWEANSKEVVKKARKRLYFLRILKAFMVKKETILNVYRSIVESVLTYASTNWYYSVTSAEKKKILGVVKYAERIIGMELPDLGKLIKERSMKRFKAITSEPEHPAYKFFEYLPSGKRLKSFIGKDRFIKSFFPNLTKIINERRR
jgi:hypothetical protein